MLYSYPFIDASPGDYEEEEVIYEEEEDHFDNCTNQGKLLLTQDITMSKLLTCKLY
jgi:hypothetical protein